MKKSDAFLTPDIAYRETLKGTPFAYTNPDLVVFPDAPAISTAAPTAEQLAARERYKVAGDNIRKVVAINKLSFQQSRAWLRTKVHAGVTESSLNTLLTNAGSVADLKPILTKIIHTQYAQTEADEEMLAILAALRDLVIPNI